MTQEFYKIRFGCGIVLEYASKRQIQLVHARNGSKLNLVRVARGIGQIATHKR